FLNKQFAPEQLYSELTGQASAPRQPAVKSSAFLKPAEGYAPPAAKPAAAPRPAIPEAPDPAVSAVVDDPALQARLTGFFAAFKELTFEISTTPSDKDIN